jgi:hypothetical protein
MLSQKYQHLGIQSHPTICWPEVSIIMMKYVCLYINVCVYQDLNLYQSLFKIQLNLFDFITSLAYLPDVVRVFIYPNLIAIFQWNTQQ